MNKNSKINKNVETTSLSNSTEDENRAKVFSEITRLKGAAFTKELEAFLDEDGGNYNFCFVNKPIGELFDERFSEISHLYIKQTTNGGMSGDSYSGTICVKIETDKFMLCRYSI